MKITHLIIVFLAVFLLLTSSCFKTELNITLGKDGSSVDSDNDKKEDKEEEGKKEVKEEPEEEEEEKDDEKDDKPSYELENEFCGYDGFDSCSSDSDCHIIGRHQHICAGLNREDMPVGSTWKECYDHNVYGKDCECVDNSCKWD
jgi:hypothetical protein